AATTMFFMMLVPCCSIAAMRRSLGNDHSALGAPELASETNTMHCLRIVNNILKMICDRYGSRRRGATMRALRQASARGYKAGTLEGRFGRFFVLRGVRGRGAELSQSLRAAAGAAVPDLHGWGVVRPAARRRHHRGRRLAEERVHLAVLHPRLLA